MEQTLDAEVWKSVHGWPQYEASTEGRIRHAATKRVRVPWWNARFNGHQLVLGGRVTYRTYFVSQVVALAFLGPCPPKGVVNHLDNDRKNNRPTNLEYTTQKGNMQHAAKQGRMARGERAAHGKLTEAQVVEIRALYKKGVRGFGAPALGKRFGVTAQSIDAIIRRTHWGWL